MKKWWSKFFLQLLEPTLKILDINWPQVGSKRDEESDAVEHAVGRGMVQRRVAVEVALVRVAPVQAKENKCDYRLIRFSIHYI